MHRIDEESEARRPTHRGAAPRCPEAGTWSVSHKSVQAQRNTTLKLT